ncbi:MAG: AMP-binding protein [Bacteroidales bacterium]|nr:AMP-binding protein [Bacteroidales bacterium]MCM1147051.1 AMP-binding protein [Bacteroidales bacterium]MCM1205816.1 AMP-binding protein [Bacillota bacterium]MCM1509940.1 AMP-binding protein [Clostridium sp.]
MIENLEKTAIIAGEHHVSYKEMTQRINHFASYTPKREEGQETVNDIPKIMIFSENREGWAYAFFAVWQNKCIAVPVDASSTVRDVAYILNDCKPTAVWTSLSHVETLRNAMDEAGVDMQIIIIDDHEQASVGNAPVDTSSLSPDPKSNDVAIIIYTSGTTGSPKGVMLSYRNLYANIDSVSIDVPIFNSERRTMILLPLHHVLPLVGSLVAPIVCGGGVAICPSMTGPDIMKTLADGKVGIFIGVPRLWQMLYTGIKKKIDEKAVTRGLFAMCRKARSPKLSRFIFQSVHKKLGGNLDFCVCGGAALDKEVGIGLRTLGLDVLEGYGMTETAPMISFTRPDDIVPGCAGLPLPTVDCKVVDGELCAKGPNLMLGYYNRPEETAEVIDKDGYIHTGDLGHFDEKGRIVITGRRKEIIVLSNGKNVQPNEIEFQIEKYDDKIKECAVTEKDDMLLAIIVPQELWADGKTDSEIETALKREVIEPYNLTVENYKKVMRILVHHGDIPRTRLDKIQRYKLKDIVKEHAGRKASAEKKQDVAEKVAYSEEFKILKKYIETEKKLPVHPESHIETDLAFDSLDKVSLQGFIEQSFGMTVMTDKMADFPNIKAMADHIASHKTKAVMENTDWHTLLTEDNTAPLPLPTTSPMLPVAGKMFKGSFKVYNSLKVRGTENIPKKGPFIIAANHQSFMDGPLVMAGVDFSQIKDCYFYATEEHVQNPVVKYLARHNNIILMEKRNLKNSILKLAQVLKQGKNVVIFPEGSRTHSGEIGRFKKMFAILAIELDIPVLPVCIRGAYDALPRGKHVMNTSHIDVEYLPVVKPSGTYDEFADKVRTIINDRL